MSTLERQFVEAVDALELPDRDLSGGVIRALTADISTERRPKRRAMVLVAVATAAALVVLSAGGAVADWFGVGSTRVEIVPSTTGRPVAPAGTVGAASATELGVTVDDHVDPGLLPGPPVAVFDAADRGRTYAWSTVDGLPALGDTDFGLLLGVRSDDGLLSTKTIADAADVEHVAVIAPDGRSSGALWISATHELLLPSGSAVLAERVLLWQRDGVEFRLEANADLDVVLELAQMVDGGTELLAPG